MRRLHHHAAQRPGRGDVGDRGERQRREADAIASGRPTRVTAATKIAIGTAIAIATPIATAVQNRSCACSKTASAARGAISSSRIPRTAEEIPIASQRTKAPTIE